MGKVRPVVKNFPKINLS